MINSPTKLRIYNTNSLQFEEITSITGAYSEIIDTYTAEITPVSQEGELKYVVVTPAGTVNVPVFFKSEYYKNPNLLPSYESYFPIGLESFSSESPTQAMMRSYSDFFESLIPTTDLVPLTDEWNVTYPQYCDNGMMGIAISLIYQERVNNGIPENMEFVRVYTIPEDSPTSASDFILTGTAVGSPDAGGKYHEVEYDGTNYFLKYGCDGSGNFCGKGKAIYIQPNFVSGSFEELLEFDTANSDRYWGSGLWNSVTNDGDLLPDLDTIQGVPAACELLFNTDPFDINEADYDTFYLPDATEWTGDLQDYNPIIWFNNIDLSAYDKSEILINYDTENKYFTFKLKKV